MKKLLLWVAAISLAVGLLGILAEYYAVSEAGNDGPRFLILPMMLPIVAALLVMLLGPIFLIRRKTRPLVLRVIAASAVYLTIGYLCLHIGNTVRRSAFEQLADRSAPLIDAIRGYELATGAPPDSLSQLVPEYLPEVPSTGMGANPEYHYFAGEEAQSRYGDRWAISVYTGLVLSFDEFWYVPSREYESTEGAVELIGQWAYLHE